MAEAHNIAGNNAFHAGDYPKAVDHYEKAVEADGKVAKYRTNLSNALLKCGRAALAIEEADAAIALDETWLKGYYFKSLALQEHGAYSRALAACEAGLRVHRHNATLEAMRVRLKQLLKQQQHEQQLQQVAGMGSQCAGCIMRTVVYRATVRDETGQEQHFRFEHQIDSGRLARAEQDQAEATQIMREVTLPHHDEMLQAKPWLCVSCQFQHGKLVPATTLYMHAMCYLHMPQPFVEDMGPTPACSSPACGAWSTLMAHKALAEVKEEIEQQGR